MKLKEALGWVFVAPFIIIMISLLGSAHVRYPETLLVYPVVALFVVGIYLIRGTL